MATRFARIGLDLGVIRRNPHLCHSTILQGGFHQTVAGVGTPVSRKASSRARAWYFGIGDDE